MGFKLFAIWFIIDDELSSDGACQSSNGWDGGSHCDEDPNREGDTNSDDDCVCDIEMLSSHVPYPSSVASGSKVVEEKS